MVEVASVGGVRSEAVIGVASKGGRTAVIGRVGCCWRVVSFAGGSRAPEFAVVGEDSFGGPLGHHLLLVVMAVQMDPELLTPVTAAWRNVMASLQTVLKFLNMGTHKVRDCALVCMQLLNC